MHAPMAMRGNTLWFQVCLSDRLPMLSLQRCSATSKEVWVRTHSSYWDITALFRNMISLYEFQSMAVALPGSSKTKAITQM